MEHEMKRLLTRREWLRLGAVGLAAGCAGWTLGAESAVRNEPAVRFAITTDCHIMGPRGSLTFLQRFVDEIKQWKPAFVIDLGDFACQVGEGQTTQALHDAQLAGLRRSWALFSQAPCPAYIAMGNHCVGWLKGGSEHIAADDLCRNAHDGEDITKDEFLGVTKMPGRYYSFDSGGYHFIVLDAHNFSTPEAKDQPADLMSRDGVRGAYYIDALQRSWLTDDLRTNHTKPKVVFCHEELHHTPKDGSPEGGDVPFPQIGKPNSYVGNGWQVRELLRNDGKVLACFHGHKHDNRWTVRDGTHYITLAANHQGGSYAKVTISPDAVRVEGMGRQKSFKIPLFGGQPSP